MEYLGPERRKMNQDQLEQIRLITEIHCDMRHMVEWSKKHDEDDDERFSVVNKKSEWFSKIAYMGIGGLFVFQLVLKLIK